VVSALTGITDLALGANVDLNTTRLFIGNTTANLNANSVLVTVADASGVANLQPTQLLIGTTIVNSTMLAAGANVVANTTALYVGNSTANAVLSQGALVVANSTFSLTVGPNSLTTGNLVANATTIMMGANVVVTTTSVTVGNSTVNVFSNSSLVSVVGDVIATANVTATNINASANVLTTILNARDGIFSGNLIVHGALTNIDATNLAVQDPLIKLANNNTTTDTVDIGWYGLYGNSTVTQYGGIFRDASDSGIIKTFRGNIPEPTTVVDTANLNFDYAVLESWINSGGLVSNSTHVNITANSTVASAIAANTLSLSTPLPATSGGTGRNTYTSGDVLVGNTGNATERAGHRIGRIRHAGVGHQRDLVHARRRHLLGLRPPDASRH